jgi:hypothetical protein
MTVQVLRERDLGMAKHFLDGMEVARRSKRKSRGSMPDLVGENNRNTSLAAELSKEISDARRIKRSSVGV